MFENELYRMPHASIHTRWYSFENPEGLKGEGGKACFGRKGAPSVALPAGETLVLADIAGSGIIRHIWATLHCRDTAALRGIRIEMYWDGAERPAVCAPIGDFFCHSFGHMGAFENACFESPPEGSAFNSYVPMPFRESAKVLLVNESGVDSGVYYEILCTEGDPHGEDMLYLHSHWRRENYTEIRKDMTILPEVCGRGRFLGCNLGVRLHPSMTNFWWGEGEVKVYLDGDEEYPTLVGTGTEDYVGAGYGLGLFSYRYQGCQFVSQDRAAFGFYRFHIPDPVYFHKDVRVELQVMGGPAYQQMLDAMDKDPALRFMKAGDGTEFYTREELEAHPERAQVMERIDDHCATAYWYMDRPENSLGPIAPVGERLADLPDPEEMPYTPPIPTPS